MSTNITISKINERINFVLLLCLFCSISPADEPRASYADEIDMIVEERLRNNGQEPNSLATEQTFIRRAYLNIIGRIPTFAEYQQWINSEKPNKKSELIDKLLASEEYAMNEVNFWTDLLRARTFNGNSWARQHGPVYVDWIQKSMNENKPYDKFVYEMLSFTGYSYQEGGGAAGYHRRGQDMPLDHIANTMRIFLGTRMECAQCHDDPKDAYTQREFYELAAFSIGMELEPHTQEYNSSKELNMLGNAVRMAGKNYKKPKHMSDEELALVKEKMLKNPAPGIDKIVNRVGNAHTGRFPGTGNGTIALPHDYQYDDAKPHQLIKAKVPFGPPIELEYREYTDDELKSLFGRNRHLRGRFYKVYGKRNAKFVQNNSRALFSKWVTSKENPRFTVVLVNRLWKKVFGMGLIEPIDKISDHTKASDPELQKLLIKIAHDNSFKLKDIYRVLYNTKLFARESTTEDIIYDKTMGFKGPFARRMTAEQLWDSLMVLRSDYIGHFEKNPEQSFPFSDFFRKTHNKSADEMISFVQEINDDVLAKKSESALKYISTHYAKQFYPKNTPVKGLMSTKYIQKEQDNISQKLLGPITHKFLRSSELPIPASSRHFLYQFGQSDRSLIQGSNQDPNLPQFLTMQNGIQQFLYDRSDSGVWYHVDKRSTLKEKIEILFQAVLSRSPSVNEADKFQSYSEAINEKEALEDILWALLNTHEFRFVE